MLKIRQYYIQYPPMPKFSCVNENITILNEKMYNIGEHDDIIFLRIHIFFNGNTIIVVGNMIYLTNLTTLVA